MDSISTSLQPVRLQMMIDLYYDRYPPGIRPMGEQFGWANVPLDPDKIDSLIHTIIQSTWHMILLFGTENYVDAATKRLCRLTGKPDT